MAWSNGTDTNFIGRSNWHDTSPCFSSLLSILYASVLWTFSASAILCAFIAPKRARYRYTLTSFLDKSNLRSASLIFARDLRCAVSSSVTFVRLVFPL